MTPDTSYFNVLHDFFFGKKKNLMRDAPQWDTTVIIFDIFIEKKNLFCYSQYYTVSSVTYSISNNKTQP